ncbi:MAG: hypothetical protein M3T55_02980 [Pseudomonadota bacterium]|nr:hypothetical protein [Pseudomonadota bacterium]
MTISMGTMGFAPILVAALWLGAAPNFAFGETSSASPKPVAPCFTVHGRLSLANGNPSFRIWPIGSSRMLGVWETGDEMPMAERFPPRIVNLFGSDPDAMNIFGDFRVCPITRRRVGHMQIVTVRSVSHAIARTSGR